jgi:hypothetical protein
MGSGAAVAASINNSEISGVTEINRRGMVILYGFQ